MLRRDFTAGRLGQEPLSAPFHVEPYEVRLRCFT